MADQMVMTVMVCSAWQDDFRAWMDGKGTNAKTIKAYMQGVNEFAGWFAQARGCDFSPELISGFDLVRYHQWVMGVARKSPATWNQRLAALRKLCKWAGKTISLPGDLFEDVKKEIEVTPPPDWLTDAEFGRLGGYLHSTAFDAYDSRTKQRRQRATRNRAIVTLLVYAGLREFELADVLFEDLMLSDRKGWVVVQRGKYGIKRKVPLGDAGARAVIRRWLEVRGSASGYLFLDDEGGRLAERTIQDICHEIGDKCKVEDLRPHRLRHTFCKRLIDAGVSLEKVSKLAGHRSIKSTLRYVEPGNDDLEQATALVGQGRMANPINRAKEHR